MAHRMIAAHARARMTVATSILCVALGPALPVAAYHVDTKTQRVTIGSLKDFDNCQRHYESSGSEACLEALKVYIQKNPREAFAAGKRARRNFMHWAALDFFAQALKHKPNKTQCADDDVSAAVLSGLSLPTRYPAVELAKKIANGACWEQLQPVLLADLEGGSGSFRSNACPLLAGRNVSAAQCQGIGEQQPPRARNVLAELKGVDWTKLPVDAASEETLRGPSGEQLALARTKPGAGDYVLLKFKSIRGPWNQQVLVAVERRTDIGKDYVVAVDNREWVALSERQGQYQAFPKGAADGIWLYNMRPAQEALALPARAAPSEFATANEAEKVTPRKMEEPIPERTGHRPR